MKTLVVCGLLGAGKTTFIRNYLQDDKKRTVVLVNDFGKAGIDGEVFSADGIESIELPSGCVCCTLKPDLISTLKKISEKFSPEQLIIEPSGIASPSGVLEALETVNISPVSVAGIVDATEFLDLLESEMYGSFFYDQVLNADIILVNKADLVNEDIVFKTLTRLGEMNPRALIMRSVNAIPEDFFPEAFQSRQPIEKRKIHLSFDSLSCRIDKTVMLQEISSLFDRIADGAFGKVVRAKALLQASEGPYRFDISFGKIDMAEMKKEIGEGRLVVIGNDLLKEELALAVKELEA
jgi:G3E family GTPase